MQVPDDPWWNEQLAHYSDSLQSVIDRALAHAEEPFAERVWIDLKRYLQAWGRVGAPLLELYEHPFLVELLVDLTLASRYGFSLVLRDVRGFIEQLADQSYRQVWGRRGLKEDLAQRRRVFGDTPATLLAFQHWHHLRVIIGDLAETLQFEHVVSELSDLTDVITDAAIDQAQASMVKRYGHPGTEFVVIGMGKLGGGELNYSLILILFLFMINLGRQVAGDKKSVGMIILRNLVNV